MARAHTIWLVLDFRNLLESEASIPVACFTVKHEFATWLDKQPVGERFYWTLWKIPDGGNTGRKPQEITNWSTLEPE